MKNPIGLKKVFNLETVEGFKKVDRFLTKYWNLGYSVKKKAFCFGNKILLTVVKLGEGD